MDGYYLALVCEGGSKKYVFFKDKWSGIEYSAPDHREKAISYMGQMLLDAINDERRNNERNQIL